MVLFFSILSQEKALEFLEAVHFSFIEEYRFYLIPGFNID